ncbi:copper resistance protein CopC [Herbiconiux sp. A18JL235]|uniref:Copper resistance protein CopC n=1 Tax=Herbiconiux sp. A18JL235 TaxID=3152363 RepID=A0AB39BH75_9MICO
MSVTTTSTARGGRPDAVRRARGARRDLARRRVLLVAALSAAAAVVTSVLGLGWGAGFVGGVAPASAHDFLVSTSPAADTTVTDPLAEVSLTFNEPPLTDLQAGIAVEVRDATGATASGALTIVNATLSVPFTPTATGGYTVVWQTVSSDGHPVSGEYGFDYQGPVSAGGESTGGQPAGPSTAASESPAAGEGATSPASPAASAPASETPAAGAASNGAGDRGGVQLPLVLAAAVGSLLVVGAVVVGIVLTMRRRRA